MRPKEETLRENHQDIYVEIGPGTCEILHLYSLSSSVQEAIAQGALYIAIDNNTDALNRVEKGAVAHMSLEELTKSGYLDNTTKLLFINNVFGAPQVFLPKQKINPVFSKFHKMLRAGGKIVITETYSPYMAKNLKESASELESIGFSVQVHSDENSIYEALSKIGIPKRMAEICGFSDLVGFLDPADKPFVMVLEKKLRPSTSVN